MFLGTLLFPACDGLEESYSTNPSLRLAFSTDTLAFDTVFTTVGSATKQFLIYNNNDEPLNMETIMLASAGSTGFRINVDGRKGDYFNNIGILAKDSMFVFVEVTVNPNGENQPLLVKDSVVFVTNGIRQSVLLEAYGQDVHLYKGGLTVLSDTLFTADKPHLVYDSIVVAEGATMRVEKGATFYMHDKANLIVSGTLNSCGTIEEPVTFRGDRLDFILDDVLPYDRTPGQWGGIYLKDGSFGNIISHTIIRNGTQGVIAEPSEPSQLKLTLSNSQITNVSENAFCATNSKVVAYNTEISNAGGSVVGLVSGDYDFTHCTLANFITLVQRTSVCLSLANNYSKDGQETIQPLDARFDNCIIDGSYGAGTEELNGEIGRSIKDGAAFEYLFNRYRDAIRRLFLQRSTPPEDTDDLLQETFIKVYANLHRYSPEYTFGQWLYTIAKNTHIDFERKRQEDISIDGKFSAPASSAPSPEESLINTQQRSQIERYIERLPQQYRRLFVMRFIDDFSYEEIAEKLHMPMGTVKTRIHRARERMCRFIIEGEKA